MALDIIAAVITYAAVGVGAWFIGGYMVKVYKGERVWLSRVIRPVERLTYKVIGVDEEHEQGWIAYLVSLLAVTVVSIVFTYLVLRFQDHLPAQPGEFPRRPRAARLQHRDELRHEHQLAELHAARPR